MLIFLLENGFIIPSLVGGSEFNHHTISFPIYSIPGNELCGGLVGIINICQTLQLNMLF
jgi:hypothetical protein